MNDSCKFFQWVDEDSENFNNMPTDNNRRTATRGRGQDKRENTKKGSRVGTGKRKCGICGVEGSYFICRMQSIKKSMLLVLEYENLCPGHTRKTCPQNAMD